MSKESGSIGPTITKVEMLTDNRIIFEFSDEVVWEVKADDLAETIRETGIQLHADL